jgi:TldD protein
MHLARHFGDLGLDAGHFQATIERAIGRESAFGEVYGESGRSAILTFDQGSFRRCIETDYRGVGVRAVSGDIVGYSYTDHPTLEILRKAAGIAHTSVVGARPCSLPVYSDGGVSRGLYPVQNSLFAQTDESRLRNLKAMIEMLSSIDRVARSVDRRIVNVTIQLSLGEKVVIIQPSHAPLVADLRPILGLSIRCVAVDGARRETSMTTSGARDEFEFLLRGDLWRARAVESAETAINMLSAVSIEAGTMPVVLASGEPGTIFHEAVGHMIEADFHHEGTSALVGKIGEMIAAPACTIVDSGIVPRARGSLEFDDEGTSTQETVLIENGRLVSLMNDGRTPRS